MQNPEFLSHAALETAIHSAAEMQGLTLAQDRLAHLVGTAIVAGDRVSQPVGQRPQYIFSDTQNFVEATHAKFSPTFGVSAAQMEFRPIIDPSEGAPGITNADASNASLFGHMIIQGIQNYALLVHANVIEKPVMLCGNTNPEMAILAERFGGSTFTSVKYPDWSRAAIHNYMRQMSRMDVEASFDTVSSRAFSDEIKRLDAVFTRRLAMTS